MSLFPSISNVVNGVNGYSFVFTSQSVDYYIQHMKTVENRLPALEQWDEVLCLLQCNLSSLCMESLS